MAASNYTVNMYVSSSRSDTLAHRAGNILAFYAAIQVKDIPKVACSAAILLLRSKSGYLLPGDVLNNEPGAVR